MITAGIADLRIFTRLHPGRAFAGVATLAALTMLLLVGLDRTFSVSCPAGTACVTFDDLERGAPLPQALRLYDRHGDLLAEVAGPLRQSLAWEQIPPLLSDAFVAVEDRRFWEHDGVDERGIARAAVRNVLRGDITEGASTIPMQLVRTIWAEALRDVGPWRRKIIEARTAPRLVERLGRERVLTLYLNAIYLGNGLYGVERASRYYFGKGVDELDAGQIATLVGITRSPESFEPHRHPDRARTVRGVVLTILADEGLIAREEADAVERRDLLLAPPPEVADRSTDRTHMTAAVTRELRRIAPELAGQPGLSIHTTLDPVVQALGEEAIREQLARIESGHYGTYEAGDSLTRLEASALALDPADGGILAWVGGRDFTASEFDRVDQSRRQVGSLVKPFLVAGALERGYGIVDMVSADTVPIPTDEGGWLPADHVAELALPLREALVRSSNRAAAQLGVGLGLDEVVRIGTRVGIRSPIPALPSSSIGAFDASLLEMTAAYAPFSNGGLGVAPHLIERIDGADGESLWVRERQEAPTRVLSPEHAFIVLDAMRAVVDRGTGSGVRGRGYRGPAAGKTGTTNDGRDAWFVGLTPEMVAGIWIGFDQPREIVAGGGGGTLAAPAWGAWMENIRRSPRPRSGAWIPPIGVERVQYSVATGEVLSLTCRGRMGSGEYHEAWVQTGTYRQTNCSEGVGGWLGRLWKAIVPGGAGDPPTTIRRPGGGDAPITIPRPGGAR